VTSHPPPRRRGSLFHVIRPIMRVTYDKRSNFSPDPVNARSLRSLGFPKSPPLKIPDPPMLDFAHSIATPLCIAMDGSIDVWAYT